MQSKTLFFIENKKQVKAAFNYYLKNKGQENITLFPLNAKSYAYLQSLKINLNNISPLFLKKTKRLGTKCSKINQEMSGFKSLRILTVNSLPFILLIEEYLNIWLEMIWQLNLFLKEVIKKYQPTKIIIINNFNKNNFSPTSIYASFVKELLLSNANIAKKVVVVRQKNYNLSLTRQKTIILNILNNPGNLVKFIYIYSKTKAKRIFKIVYDNKSSFFDTKRILVFAYKHQLKNIIPLLNKIMKHKDLKLFLITYGLGIDELNLLYNNKINYYTIKDLESKINKKFISKHKSVKTINKNIFMSELKKLFKKHNIPELTNVYFNLIQQCINRYYLNAVKSEYLAKRILSKFNPDLIVNINDFKILSQLLIKQARVKKIPSLLLQHGGLGGKNANFKFYSDYCGLWGKYYEKLTLSTTNKNNKQLRVLGNFYLDHLKKFKNYRFSNWSKLKNKKTVIVGVLTTFYTTEFKHAVPYYFLKKALTKLNYSGKRFKLILRVHPGYPLDGFKTERGSLDRFIKRSDIIISEDTSAGIEAAAYGKPLIYFNPCYIDNGLPLATFKSALSAKSWKEVINNIKTVLSSPKILKNLAKNQKKLINNCYYKLDGKSCERTIKFIKDILIQSTQ